jgi:hypothetical protein
MPSVRASVKPSGGIMKLVIEKKNVYGNEVFYPVNDTAKTFASIAGTKTLLPSVLAKVKSLGYEIELHQPTFTI